MKKIGKFAALALAVFGWWGLLYPDMSLVEGTYAVVLTEEGTEADETEYEALLQDSCRLFYSILEADPGQIVIKSKMMRK